MKNFFKEFGVARVVIIGFVLLLFVLAVLKDMQVASLISDSLARVARNGILVLALLPGVRGGIGLNFGLPLGILCGLVGMIVSMEFDCTGLFGFLVALSLGVGIAAVVGVGYGILLNKVRGQEMMVGTYLGFGMVSLMCIFWLIMPFTNHKLVWAISGAGLRTTISLEGYYLQILDGFGAFSVFGVQVPTGSLLFFAGMCALVYYFFQTRFGLAMATAGSSDRFARLSGIQPSRMRVAATALSTMLAAVGILVYNQSFGFVQLYSAPLLMAFPIVACLLIGGGSLKKATIFHVVFGALVFQTLLTIALPVTSELIGGDISETARIIISNGIILYALVGSSKK